MVLSAMRERLFQIGEVLNGGIWLFAPGEIRWAGNRFAQESLAFPRLHVSAEVEQKSPAKLLLKLEVASDRSIANYEVEQDFDGGWDVPVPRRIRTYLLTGPSRDEKAAIDVLRARRLDEPLSVAAFDPRRFYPSNQTSELVLTNDQVLAVRADGSLAEVAKISSPKFMDLSKGWLRALSVVAVIATGFAAVAVLAKLRRQRLKPLTE